VNNPFTLESKVILVTGASSGIGKSIAIECAKLGAQLIITGRDKKRLNETFIHLDGNGHIQFIADLAINEERESLVNILPKIDGFVNVAGVVVPKPFNFINAEALEEVMQINFTAPTLLTNLVLRKRLLTKNSSVVFISSISGTMCSFVGGSLYSASKGALNGMIKGIALDLAPRGIRVNSVIPGMIDTGIFNDSAITEQDLIEDRKRYPLGRYGTPKDVAYAVIYLLSEASSWVTGSNLLIDGGYTLI